MNLRRLQKKGEIFLSQEYYKDITVQHKNRKVTLTKIASPALMDTCEAESSDETSTIEK